jgi:uncharacterized protein
LTVHPWLSIILSVNDNHTEREWIYKARYLADRLRKTSSVHPVLVLTGARQVGKSTLLREEEPFRSWRYLTLDDIDLLDQAQRDPSALWAGLDEVVIDEVQRAPRILSEVKKTVDDRRRKIRFVLSGSANLLMMSRVSESLAGRAVVVSLLPMTHREGAGRPPPGILPRLLAGDFDFDEGVQAPGDQLAEILIRGQVPPVFDLPGLDSAIQWWDGFVTTYLERDLRQLSQIESLPDFRQVMRALALRSGQMLNQTEVARDVRVSQPTVHRYVSLLETTMVLVRLEAFSINRTKRLIKTPKVYWTDPGMACFLASHHDPRALTGSREMGGLFETLVLLGLRAEAERLTPRASLYYWRTTGGKEVDFVMEHGRNLLALEAKLTDTPRQSHLAGLRLFLQEYPECKAAVLVHTGTQIRRMDEKIIAIPWWRLS